MNRSRDRLSGCYVGLLVSVLTGVVGLSMCLNGCGLGFIDIQPELLVALRIENAASQTAQVTIKTTTQRAMTDTESGETVVDTAEIDSVIRVQSGHVTSGSVRCGDSIMISVLTGPSTADVVELTGAGTGTPGFDSGSVGLTGERFLIAGSHFNCDDTILLKLPTSSSGQLDVIPVGVPLPDPITNETSTSGAGSDPAGDTGGTTPTESDVADASKVTLRIENATATVADITITLPMEADGDSSEPGSLMADVSGPVRVIPGQFTTGQIDCGQTFQITGVMVDAEGSAISFSGDGTGTIGFDSASVGLSGERWLVFDEDYRCSETIVIRVSDDGSGIGPSTGQTAHGEVNVFAGGVTLPEPDLPDPDTLASNTTQERVTLVVANETESTVQINFSAGDGSLAGGDGVAVDDVDIRIPPGTSSTGSMACAQEYVIAATHLEPTSSVAGSGATFHGVVLTGDGTGTEGFDSQSLAVVGGRLLQLGTHFECPDTITVTVTRTNNQVQLDDEGLVITDEFGNPTIKYNVGLGTVTVADGF